MQKVSFILKELSIQKMPGFPRGLEAYKDFAANINIIAGPNASGKSSTSRIIQQVIWRNHTDGIQVESSNEIEQENWDIKIDSRNIQVQRDGKDDELVGLPAVEGSNRYVLALHELVKEKDEEIAKEIIRQSIGGYNLEEAQQNLGYADLIKNKGATEFKNYKTAKEKHKEIQQKHKELKREEERLQELDKTKDQAQQASRLKDLYEKVTEYIKARLNFDQLSEEYETYPKVLDKVNGEEHSAVEDLEKETGDAENAVSKAENEIKKCENILSKLDLPNDGVSQKVLSELEERVDNLIELGREIQDTEKKIEEFRAKERVALDSIDKSIDPEKWKGLNLKDVSGLDKFLQNAHKANSEKQFLETGINELKKEVVDKDPKPEILNEGIKWLSYWLQEQSSTAGILKWWPGVLSLAGILTAISAYFIGWPGLLGIVVIIVLAIYVYTTKPHRKKKIREQDYGKTGLKQPDAWSIEGVSEKLEELVDELKEVRWQDKINHKITGYTTGIEDLQPQLDEINKTRDEWLEKLKAVPDLPSADLKNYAELFWFLDKVNKWQKNHAEAEALTGRNKQLSNTLAEDLEQINKLFSDFKADRAGDATEAKAILKKLEEDENIRQKAEAEIGRQKEQIKEQEQQKKKFSGKLENIYKKLDIAHGEKEEIRQLVEKLEAYKKAKDNYKVAGSRLSEKEGLMKDHSLYEPYKEEIALLSFDHAQVKMEGFEAEANKIEAINKEITEIETNIKNTKKCHALEDALTEQEEALNNLEQLYENNLSSISGKLIIDQLKEETREQNQSKVFKRANQLLNRITNGRYELRLEDKKEPAFRAYDTVLKLGQDLSKLSTGTRIQLLLSVRLAFIETQESSIKLPILADELLANSDDIRAKAIIEALIEISKEGRQVFYFTAQADEVTKWRSFLEKSKNISYKIIELTGGQNETINYETNEPAFRSFDFIQNIPVPANKSHWEYGKLLQVTPFNILSDEPEQIHLWYLVEDNKLLFHCLKKGIRQWGQLASFVRNNGTIEGLDEDTMFHFQNKVKLLERFIELYCIGRPRPIDREILEQSDAVSGNFIEEVNTKLVELDRNPIKLIRALKNREVSGFRDNKTDELEQYLTNEGYIDYHEALGKDEILVQLNALLSNLDVDTAEAESLINRIF